MLSDAAATTDVDEVYRLELERHLHKKRGEEAPAKKRESNKPGVEGARVHPVTTKREKTAKGKEESPKEAPRAKRFGVIGKDARWKVIHHAVPTQEDVWKAQMADAHCREAVSRCRRLPLGQLLDVKGYSDIVYGLREIAGRGKAEDAKPRTLLVIQSPPDQRGMRETVMVIPEGGLRKQFIELAHHAPIAGHQGRESTHQRLTGMAWWPKMREDVADACKTCYACQRQRVPSRTVTPLEEAWETNAFGEVVHVDLVGMLHTADDPQKSKFILSIVDRHTRWTRLVAISSKEASCVAKALAHRWILEYGSMSMMMSDRGTEFCNPVIASLCDYLWIARVRAAAYHPAANGRVERMHRNLGEIARKLCGSDHAKWADMLTMMEFCLNTSVNRATGTTPFRAMFGRDPRIVFDAVDIVDPEKLGAKAYGKKIAGLLHETWRQIRIVDAQTREKRQADERKRRHLVAHYQVGDLVWRANPISSDPRRMLGPYKVLRDCSHGKGKAFELVLLGQQGGKTTTVNAGDISIYLREGRDGKPQRANVDQSDTHDDVCYRCADGGRLLLCEGCHRAAHAQCEGIAEVDVDKVDYVCEYCKGTGLPEDEEDVDTTSRVPTPGDWHEDSDRAAEARSSLRQKNGVLWTGKVEEYVHDTIAGRRMGKDGRWEYKTFWAGPGWVYTWEPASSFSSRTWPEQYDALVASGKGHVVPDLEICKDGPPPPESQKVREVDRRERKTRSRRSDDKARPVADTGRRRTRRARPVTDSGTRRSARLAR